MHASDSLHEEGLKHCMILSAMIMMMMMMMMMMLLMMMMMG